MKLRDGRTLNVREYGDPDGEPVLYNHGGLLCSRDAAPADAAARSLGIRLIAPDRPGVGLSDRSPGRVTADWADDVGHLLESLRITRFSAVGWSLGGQYALALGRAAHRLVLVAPALPLTGRWLREVNPTDRLFARTAMRAPGMARVMLGTMRVAGPLTSRVTQRLVCAEDREVLVSLPEFTSWMNEGLAQPGGVVDEYRSTVLPWGFDVADVTCPVVIWQGEQDTLVPPHWAAVFAEQLPNAQVRAVKEAGHFLAYRRWYDVLRDTVT